MTEEKGEGPEDVDTIGVMYIILISETLTL